MSKCVSVLAGEDQTMELVEAFSDNTIFNRLTERRAKFYIKLTKANVEYNVIAINNRDGSMIST
jgi:hypothetical protein